MYIHTITTNINFKSSKKTSYFILHTLNSVPLKVFHDVFIFVSFAMYCAIARGLDLIKLKQLEIKY